MKRLKLYLFLIASSVILLTSCSSVHNTLPSEDLIEVSSEETIQIIDETPNGRIYAWPLKDIPDILYLTDGPSLPRLFSYECPSTLKGFEVGCDIYKGHEKIGEEILLNRYFASKPNQEHNGDILISGQNNYVRFRDYYKKNMDSFDKDGKLVGTIKDMDVWAWDGSFFPVIGKTESATCGGINILLSEDETIFKSERIDLLLLLKIVEQKPFEYELQIGNSIKTSSIEEALMVLPNETISYVFYIRFI